MRAITTWYTPRLERDLPLVRWGHWGQPVLLFPTAGGDAEEAERHGLIQGLQPMIEAGRIKVYSIDSYAGRTWITQRHDPGRCVWVQKQFDAYVREEVVPAIRMDCRDDQIEIIATGASIGAYNAILSLVRHPDVFSHALGMSGTYDIEHWLGGQDWPEFYQYSPVHLIHSLGDGPQLARLRQRSAILACGQGRWESPEDSWKVANALGGRGVPNRVDLWDPQWDHDWPTWQVMLPQYLSRLVP